MGRLPGGMFAHRALESPAGPISASDAARGRTRRRRKGEPMLKEFKKFVLRGNVVDLAVGVVMGAAFAAVVSGFTSAFITPLIALASGESGFENLRFVVGGTPERNARGELIDP